LIHLDPKSDLAKAIQATGEKPPRYVTQQELTNLSKKHNFPGWVNSVQKKADGGSIHKNLHPNISLEQYKAMVGKGKLRQARTFTQDLQDMLAKKMPATRFDIGPSHANEYESGNFTNKLKKAGLHVHDDMMGTVHAGRTPHDLMRLMNAQTPIEHGLSYGYTPEDIAHFYAARRGGKEELGHADFLSDLQNITKANGGSMKPLTKRQFESQFAQHIDLRGRTNKSQKENAKQIMEHGFQSGIGVNAFPPYSGGEPQDIMSRKFKPQAGDTVYLAPKGAWKDTPNGMKIVHGWKPEPHHVVQVEDPNQSMYDAYIDNLNQKSDGGAVKPVGYTKEKVTVSPSLDRMQYELMSVKHFKKAK
jgi:hypothetical protein